MTKTMDIDLATQLQNLKVKAAEAKAFSDSLDDTMKTMDLATQLHNLKAKANEAKAFAESLAEKHPRKQQALEMARVHQETYDKAVAILNS